MALPDFDIPDLAGRLRQLVAQVPAGRVTTCGALAAALGNPVAARWIGHDLLHHAHDAQCPCHRVVRAEGVLGPYIAGDSSAKARRLADEGVTVRQAIVDLKQYGFAQFTSDRPLETMQRVQEALGAKVRLRPPRRALRWVGGVDVAYPNDGEGVAAYALVDAASGKLLWSTTLRRRVVFPYITSYLTFRELPIVLELLEKVRAAGQMPAALLVDGSGILHPRHAGLATHLGVVADLPTVGVTKKLLCGAVDLKDMKPLEHRPVVHEDRLIGVALRPTSGSQRPIFISPGHRMDVATAEQVVAQLLAGHRLPEPLYWADRLSRHPAENV
jgi:deoxyribonuclease V